MVEMTRGQELHTRAYRGERLSEQERSELDLWYAKMDSEEATTLHLDFAGSPSNEDLRSEIRDRLADLQVSLAEISKIEDRNALLRQQNEELKRQLVSKGILTA